MDSDVYEMAKMHVGINEESYSALTKKEVESSYCNEGKSSQEEETKTAENNQSAPTDFQNPHILIEEVQNDEPEAGNNDCLTKNKLALFLNRKSRLFIIIFSVALSASVLLLFGVVAYLFMEKGSPEGNVYDLESDDVEIQSTANGHIFSTTTEPPASSGPISLTNPMSSRSHSQETSTMWIMSTVSVSLPIHKPTSVSEITHEPMKDVADSTDTNESVPEDDCDPDLCQHGGICADLMKDYRCTCVAGYTGKSCELDIDECIPNPCHRHGICTDLLNDYRCTCVAGYTGKSCQTDIKWPAGSYGLPQTNSGCPASVGVHWQTGWRKHDTEDDNSSNDWTSPNHFVAKYGRNNMEQHFCIKIAGGEGIWPRGNYCIFKKGSCPYGFSSGSIYWDDEDDDNANAAGGSLPDGQYHSNTLIYYCCRQDGAASSAINLPINAPFFLFRFRSSCQQVRGASVRQEYFKWDDEDDNNKNSVSGYHPYDDGGSNHRIFYCYYSRR